MNITDFILWGRFIKLYFIMHIFRVEFLFTPITPRTLTENVSIERRAARVSLCRYGCRKACSWKLKIENTPTYMRDEKTLCKEGQGRNALAATCRSIGITPEPPHVRRRGVQLRKREAMVRGVCDEVLSAKGTSLVHRKLSISTKRRSPAPPHTVKITFFVLKSIRITHTADSWHDWRFTCGSPCRRWRRRRRRRR
jgi:hypothetical protein